MKSILTKSLNRYSSQRETEPYDIAKFERGLILLRNKPEIREKVYLMIDSLQTDMHNLIFVLGKLKSLSMMEDRINLKQVEIEGLSKELDFI